MTIKVNHSTDDISVVGGGAPTIDSATIATTTYAIEDTTDIIKDTHIDWGSGAGQIDADNISDGSTNAMITLTQETNFESAYTHISVVTGNPHAVTATEVGLGSVVNSDTTDADNISDGSTNAIITLTQETNFETAYSHTSVVTGNPHVVTATDIGLGDVVNADTTDADNISNGTVNAIVNLTQESNWDTHLSSDGTDHTYIDQDVTSGSSPTFGADNISDGSTNAIITLTQETNFDAAYTHVSNDGSDHSLIDQDVTSGASPTFGADNLSDGSTNAIITLTQETNFESGYTHVSNDGSDHSYIDQDVTSGSAPTFAGIVISDTGTIRPGMTEGDYLNIQAYDVDGTTWINYATLTSGDSPSFDLSPFTTIGTVQIGREGSGVYYAPVVKTAAYTSVVWDIVLADTATTGAFTVDLPAVPSAGDMVKIIDVKSNFATANLTIDSNSLKIRGSVQNITADVNDAVLTFIYTGATDGWVF